MLRRGLPIGDVFCVQAVIAPSRFPLVGAWCVCGEGGVCFASRGTLCCPPSRSFLCLPGILNILFLIGIWEENQSHLLFGRKALQVCLVWGGGGNGAWNLSGQDRTFTYVCTGNCRKGYVSPRLSIWLLNSSTSLSFDAWDGGLIGLFPS